MNFKKMAYLLIAFTLTASIFLGCSEPKVEDNKTEITSENNLESAEINEIEKYDDYFVSVDWLEENLTKENLIIVDARGEETYNKGHITGSVATTWQALSNMGVDFASPGWGSVIDEAALESGIRNLGIDKDSQVVIYADTENGWGEDGRLYWTLKIAGIENVKMLDGGYNLWTSLNKETTKEKTEVLISSFKLEGLNLAKSINTSELAESINEYKIIDTRDLDEYEGAVKFGEARGGHIPGAIWVSYKSLLNKDGSLKSESELSSIFSEAGINKDDKIATYCTAGIRSAHMAVVLEMLGYENAQNYDESFYVWANDKEQKIGRVVNDKSYNYYTSEDLRNTLLAEKEIVLVDIQVEDEYKAHHIKGAIETNAYPVKSEEEKAKLDDVINLSKETDKDIVIVCPRGGGGAERTFDYFMENGIKSSRVYILEGGQAGWGYNELLEK